MESVEFRDMEYVTAAAPSLFCTYGLPSVIAAFKEQPPDWGVPPAGGQ